MRISVPAAARACARTGSRAWSRAWSGVRSYVRSAFTSVLIGLACSPLTRGGDHESTWNPATRLRARTHRV
ncbi:MAG TPA: hypothetical protein VFH94_14960 [Streptomyces sp.]|nr:hypothetical protein [Streptomyces sp.]